MGIIRDPRFWAGVALGVVATHVVKTRGMGKAG